MVLPYPAQNMPTARDVLASASYALGAESLSGTERSNLCAAQRAALRMVLFTMDAALGEAWGFDFSSQPHLLMAMRQPLAVRG